MRLSNPTRVGVSEGTIGTRPDFFARFPGEAASAQGGTGHAVLVQDLLRGTVGYVLAWSALRLLSRSHIAREDGPRSVRAAFSLPEVRTMAVEAGLAGAVIRRGWPERFVLRWRGS